MPTQAQAVLSLQQLEKLVPALRSSGYQVIDPVVRDGAIVPKSSSRQLRRPPPETNARNLISWR